MAEASESAVNASKKVALPMMTRGQTCQRENGTDSTVEGPQGLPGKPPASWSWPDPNPLFPVIHTCTRNPDSPDDAATYMCN